MIVLDTHAWIWFVDAPEKLGKRAATAIDKAHKAGEQLHISCISTWEVHMLASKQRLSLAILREHSAITEWIIFFFALRSQVARLEQKIQNEEKLNALAPLSAA